MHKLQRFWFRFANIPQFSALNLGCGVTAYHYEDAIEILASKVFSGKSVPEIESVSDNIDINSLDVNHVLPNIGLVTIRGVWFPLGF